MPVSVSAQGLSETKRNLDRAASDVHGQPMREGMRKATLVVEAAAKRNAPVDTGRLRASITSEVRVEGIGAPSVQGVVGSNVVYAPYVELGTRPHMPPVGALEAWARRHRLSAYLVGRTISRRGTRPVKYLQNALESSRPRIVAILGESVSSMVRKANG